MKKKGWTAWLRRKQYVLAGALVVVAAIGTTVFYSSAREEERRQIEVELAEEKQEAARLEELARQEAAREEEQEAAQASGVIPPKNTDHTIPYEATEAPELAQEPTEDPADAGDSEAAEAGAPAAPAGKPGTQPASSAVQTLHFAPEDGIRWPMEGNVIINYSMDSTVYFPTLDQYKYNPAVIIEGEVNDKVYAVAKGKVSAIETDEVTGCTMTVDLGDGYQAVYGQLKEPNFAVGDYVEAGHVLGYLGEPTKYFSVEGSNLYFELQKDGSPIDPVEYFTD